MWFFDDTSLLKNTLCRLNKKDDPVTGRLKIRTEMIYLPGSVGILASSQPSTGGHVLDIGITQVLGRDGCLGVGDTLGVATISDDERVFVREANWRPNSI